MKKKIVIKMQFDCDKCQVKAMKLAASVDGVDSLEIQGEERNHLVVIGQNVDCTNLVTTLRKKVGRADIVSVATVEEKEKEKEKGVEEAPIVVYGMKWNSNYYPYSQEVMHEAAYDLNYNLCSIM